MKSSFLSSLLVAGTLTTGILYSGCAKKAVEYNIVNDSSELKNNKYYSISGVPSRMNNNESYANPLSFYLTISGKNVLINLNSQKSDPFMSEWNLSSLEKDILKEINDADSEKITVEGIYVNNKIVAQEMTINNKKYSFSDE